MERHGSNLSFAKGLSSNFSVLPTPAESHTAWAQCQNMQGALRPHSPLGADTELFSSYLHVVEHFEEGECHATTNDHLIDLIQHVIDQLDLILNFGSVREKRKTMNNEYGDFGMSRLF